MFIKKAVICPAAALVLIGFAFGLAQAASDGELDQSSTAECNISIDVGPSLALLLGGLATSDTTSLGKTSRVIEINEGQGSIQEQFCVKANTGTGLMQVSANPDGKSFSLSSRGGERINYDLNVRQGDRVISLDSSASEPAVISTCSGRSAKQGAQLDIDFNKRELTHFPRDESAQGSLVITLEPV